VRSRVVLGLVVAVAIGALALAWRYTGFSDFHLVDRLVEAGEQARESAWAPAAMIAAFVVAGLTLVPLTLMIAATAALFGPWIGVPLALAGALASGSVTFAIGRLLERRVIRRIAGERLADLSRRLARRGLIAVTLIRLLPVAPYSVVNVVAGGSRIRWRDFLIGTALGLSPGLILTSAFIDRAIAAMQEPNAASVAALALVLVAILATGWAIHQRFGPVVRRR
jgi:uncharacterized membrane protein YdjX (TVP38/TMEM64 family)